MPAQSPRSIRRFLIWGILLTVAASLTISALVGYSDAMHESEELFDARLAQSARITERLLASYLEKSETLSAEGRLYDAWETVHPQVTGEPDEAGPFGHGYEHKLYFLLLDSAGRPLLRSPYAPASSPGSKPGFGYHQYNGHEWRTFTLQDVASQRWLIVAERDDVRSEMAGKIAIRTMLPLLIVLPFLLVMLWWLVAHATRPMNQLIQAISERHPANLSPLVLKRPIKELLPLANEINRLMRALSDALEREKNFTNEAAHELRTPLAVLRIHGENALATRDTAEREQSLRKMLRALDRSERMIQQLLTQARIDNQQAIALETLDLNGLLRESVATLAPLALQKNQDLAVEADQVVRIRGQAVLLGLLFSNLIDNAIRYTPQGGEILVRLSQDGEWARIEVCDTGPGVAPEHLPHLWERFFRINPQQGDGAGLGLSIVRRIAELHGAGIEVRNRESGGLEVSVLLPCERSETLC